MLSNSTSELRRLEVDSINFKKCAFFQALISAWLTYGRLKFSTAAAFGGCSFRQPPDGGGCAAAQPIPAANSRRGRRLRRGTADPGRRQPPRAAAALPHTADRPAVNSRRRTADPGLI